MDDHESSSSDSDAGKAPVEDVDWTQVYARFTELRDATSEERTEALAGTDRSVCEHVLELLRHHDRATGFLRDGLPSSLANTEEAAPPEDVDNLAIAPNYRVVRELGRGGMGIVLLAQQLEPSRDVALKVLRGGLGAGAGRQRFASEVELLARLRHPSIAQVYESGLFEDDRPWFAMEFVPGARDVLSYANGAELGLHERIRLFVQVCEAVHHAHLRGVVHRDLKPSNILVDESGRPIVIDFGVARLLDDDAAGWTRTGQVVGTARYMSPEQLDPSAAVDLRTDVFTMGIVLFELLTDQWPFQSSSDHPLALVEAVREQEARRLSLVRSELRGDLETVVSKALEKDPDQRYMSLRDLADDLERVLTHRPIHARGTSAAYRARKFLRRNRLAVSAGCIVLLGLSVGAALAWHGLGRARSEANRAWTATERAEQEKARAEQASTVARDERLRAEAEAGRAEAQRARAESERERAEAERDRAELAFDFVARGLAAANPRNMGRNVSVQDFVDSISQSAEASYAAEPLVAGRLLETTGRVYLALGRVPEGARDIERSLELRRANLEPGHADRIRLLGFLADAEMLRNDHATARDLAERALDEHALAYGSNPESTPTYARLLCSYGMALFRLGDLSDAEGILLEALEAERALSGASSEAALAVESTLGTTLIGLGRPAEAREILERILGVQRDRHYGDDPDIMIALLQLAALERSHGDPGRALQLATEGAEMAQQILGPGHPDTARALHGQALALLVNEEPVAAEELILRSIQIFEAALGRDFAGRRLSELALAEALSAQGQKAEADRLRALHGLSPTTR